MGLATANKNRLWNNGIVYFTISGRLSPGEARTVRSSIAEWERRTLLTFQEDSSRTNRIEFVPGPLGMCTSPVGRRGGRQEIRCTSGTFRVLVHEIGHAIGLHHEHQRPDRDGEITVHLDNIANDGEFAYELKRGELALGDYDHFSVMHYDAGTTLFAQNPASPVITPKPGKSIRTAATPGNLTDLDIRTVELLYGREPGDLIWYKQRRNDASFEPDWQFPYGKRVGTGWQHYETVLAPPDSDGALYAVDARGNLIWYRHLGQPGGTSNWVFETGRGIGTGWGRFLHVFGTSGATIYGIEPDGDLMWYRHSDPARGSASWVRDTGTRVGSGWNRFRKVVGSQDGVIYAMEANGDLKWYQHLDFRSGGSRWHSSSGQTVGSGWHRFNDFAADAQNLYAIEPDGVLQWYRHLGYSSGAASWSRDTGTPIGTGWEIYRSLSSAGDGVLYGRIK